MLLLLSGVGGREGGLRISAGTRRIEKAQDTKRHSTPVKWSRAFRFSVSSVRARAASRFFRSSSSTYALGKSRVFGIATRLRHQSTMYCSWAFVVILNR
jgi:hypothetical protein